MSQADQGYNPDSSSNIPVKRKRGRPRKYPRQIEENAHMSNNQNLNLGQNAGIGIPPPPGFQRRDGNQPHQAAPINVPTDGLVGTPVSGVIEGTFNGGYLVRIRVGNSETTLTGLVLKRGSYIPVSGLNDVAPNVQMIERVQTGKQVPSVASKDKQVPPVAPKTVDPVFTRGNLSPVILQPRNSSNWVRVTSESTSVATQAAHLATSKGKEVPSVAPPSNGSTTSPNQASTVGNHAFVSQLESIHPVMSDCEQNENGSFNQPSTEVLLETEAKSMRLPDMPFEKLVTEVVKRIHAPSQSVKTCNEPLEAMQCKDHSTPASKPPEDSRNGKMSELLQVKGFVHNISTLNNLVHNNIQDIDTDFQLLNKVLQESMREREVPLVEGSTASSIQNLDERTPEILLVD